MCISSGVLKSQTSEGPQNISMWIWPSTLSAYLRCYTSNLQSSEVPDSWRVHPYTWWRIKCRGKGKCILSTPLANRPSEYVPGRGVTCDKAEMIHGHINGWHVSCSNVYIQSTKRKNQGEMWHVERRPTSPWVTSACHVTPEWQPSNAP